MPRPVLTRRALNRALLARQLLLDRSTQSIPDALAQVGGLQTQYAPSGYIGLWSRLANFERRHLTDALVDRSVVQATLMRSTIHMVAREDYWLFARGTLPARREWWLRGQGRALDGIDVELVQARVRELLGSGPRRHAEMVKSFADEGLPRIAWVAGSQLVDLVRVPPSGTWENRRADLYGLAVWWLGDQAVDTSEAHRRLVTGYLRAFGPASVADIASWAGLPATTVRSIVGALHLISLPDDTGHELLDVPDGLLPDPDTPAPVRFLGTWEALLLVHARRTGVLPEEYRPLIFHTKAPHSFPTFLVDGRVAGTWRYDKGRLSVTPFSELARRERSEVDAEAARLAAFHETGVVRPANAT